MPQLRARRRRRKLNLVGTGALLLVGITIIFRFHRLWLAAGVMPLSQAPPSGDLAALAGNDNQLRADEANLLAAVNQLRRESGLRPLQLSAPLERVARQHSYDMSASSRFSHAGSDGTSPVQRLHTAGINYALTGENIYKEQNPDSTLLAKRAVQGWLSSAPHRKNLLSPDFNQTGIGVAHSNGATYVTEDFVKE